MIKKFKKVSFTVFALVCVSAVMIFTITNRYIKDNNKSLDVAVDNSYACRPCGNSQSGSYKWVSGQPSNCGAARTDIKSQAACEALNNTGSSGAGGKKCYLCNGTNYFYSSSAPCNNAIDVEISDENSCLNLNPITCRLCGNKYTWTNDPNCTFKGSPSNQTACEALNNTGSSNASYACRPCGNSQSGSYKWVSGQPSNCGTARTDITSEAACEALNNTSSESSQYDWEKGCQTGTVTRGGCFTCNNNGTTNYVYKNQGDKVCTFCTLGTGFNLDAATCAAKNSASREPSSPSTTPQGSSGTGSTNNITSVQELESLPVTNDRIPISDFVEDEITLDPPSRATNAATGTCEDYTVTWAGDVDGGVVIPSWSKYRYYSAQTNCTDNQGQEFVAFCVDPANNGPRASSNYTIDRYIDPHDGDFSKGVVYVYKRFLETGMSLMDRCAAENAIRYLEYDSSVGGGIAARTSGPYSRDAQAYLSAVSSQTPLAGGSCASLAWSWYQEAKTANVEEVAQDYGASNIEIVPDSDYSQDDSGNVSGHLIVQTPSGDPVTGTITCQGPSGISCVDEGNGRLSISGTLDCGDTSLTASATTEPSGDSNIKSVLLVVSKKENSLQRFILFQTGGDASTAGATFEFDGVEGCSECQTSVDFSCVPESSYINPIILKEGTKDGAGDTEWAACVYNGQDEKGNTFNALKNDYCVVSCVEDWDFRLPGNIQTVSGRNFSFSAQIGAKRTCKLVGDASGNSVITPVNYRRSDGFANSPAQGHTSFAEDYYYWANIMVENYNKYLYQKAVVQAINDYKNEVPPNQSWYADGATQTSNPGGYDSECNGSPNMHYNHRNNTMYYSNGADLTQYVARYFKTKYMYATANSAGHVWSVGATSSDQYYYLDDNEDTDSATSDAYTRNVENINYNPHDASSPTRVDISCTRTETEHFAEEGNETYQRTIADETSKMNAAKSQYEQAVSKIKEILEMYKECTDWENEYTFNPEIRFTYQEEAYMDLLLQHQNKNYLINRKELEKSRKSALSLFDMEIAVGTPGADTDALVGGAEGNGSLIWPAPSSQHCSRGFGTPDGSTGYHYGMDIAAGAGTPVVAAAGGTIVEAGYHPSYGNTIVIDHGNGIRTRYAHMSSLLVTGGSVSQGQQIGTVGSTGNSTGPHLHFEVLQGGNRMGPAQYIGAGDGSCADGRSSLPGDGDGLGATSLGNTRYLNEVLTYGIQYNYIVDTGGYVGTINQETVKEATYGESEVEYKAEETEYRSGVYFYTINDSGRVTTDKNAEGATKLGYVYPVSLNTPQGDYPYYLNFGYVGMYNDSNKLGRIMGAAESSVLSGEAADYACQYNVCDPTKQDCPTLKCVEVPVKENGKEVIHYYGDPNINPNNYLGTGEAARLEYIRQCYRPEGGPNICKHWPANGVEIWCDINGNCGSDSQHQESWKKTCDDDDGGGNQCKHWPENGVEHWCDINGNCGTDPQHQESWKKTCDDPDDGGKICERYPDENGNDVFCDANGNCSNDPSSYLKTCAKDCAGYSLVSYNSFSGAKVESSGRLQFLPKVVSLNNLFSSGNQSAKAINWQNSKAETARKEIETNGEKIFANSQYEFNLSPSAMATIRNYNKQQENNDKGYADFELKCDENGSDCVSNFLNNISSMGVDVVKRDTSFRHDNQGYSYK